MDQTDNLQGQQLADTQKTEAEQRAFYDSVMTRTRDALAATTPIERTLDVAGVIIRLVFAGPRLDEAFMPALAHLVRAPVETPNTILYVWDSDSTGVRMEPPPCPRSAFTDRGDIWGFSSTKIRSAFHWSEFSVNLLDVEAGVGVYWIDTTENLPYWAKSSPLRSLFHWLMEARGLQLVHAAAVGTEHGGVLITGKGGVGKSTTALAALAAGMAYVGDDYLIVGLDPEPTAYTLYSTAKVEPHQLEALPALAPLAGGQVVKPGEKAVLDLYPARANQIVRSLPLKWVLSPRFNDGKAMTEFEPISPVELHRAAAFTTMSQLPHAGLKTHRFIQRMIETTPRRRIRLGHDITGVIRAIADLLADPDAAAAPDLPPPAAQPLVTVIVPTFNGARFLPEAIASILDQKYAALEVIVVDDGSTDEIEAAVQALPIDVRFFRQENAGPSAARNRGIRDASGEYIAFLDVDDLWPAENLASLMAEIQASEADIAIGRGQLAQVTAEGELQYIGNPEQSFPHYIGAAVYRRDVFERIGLFDEEMRYGEDTDWYNRARESGLDVRRLEQVSLIVRRHAENMTLGKSMVELHALRVAKKALDRKRAAARLAGAT